MQNLVECSNLSLCLAYSTVIIVCYYSNMVSGVIFIFFQEVDEPGHQSCLGTSMACRTDHQHLLLFQCPTAQRIFTSSSFSASLCFLSYFSKEDLSILPLYKGLILSFWQTEQAAIFMTEMPDRNFLSVPNWGGIYQASIKKCYCLNSLVILPLQAGLH